MSPFDGRLAAIGGGLGLGTARIARLLAAEIVRAAGPRARLLATSEPLARALASHDLAAFAVVRQPRRRRAATPQLVADPAALPLPTASLDAACLAGLPAFPAATLTEVARVVRPGGLIAVATLGSALVRRVAPPDALAALFLHALLVDLEQQEIGSTLVTTARVHEATHALVASPLDPSPPTSYVGPVLAMGATRFRRD